MKLHRWLNPDWLAINELVLAGFPIPRSNNLRPRRETGTVVKVDPDHHTLTLAPRLVLGEHVWHWNRRTRVTLGGQPASVRALKEGDRVRTRGVKRDRQRIAREIMILPA